MREVTTIQLHINSKCMWKIPALSFPPTDRARCQLALHLRRAQPLGQERKGGQGGGWRKGRGRRRQEGSEIRPTAFNNQYRRAAGRVGLAQYFTLDEKWCEKSEVSTGRQVARLATRDTRRSRRRHPAAASATSVTLHGRWRAGVVAATLRQPPLIPLPSPTPSGPCRLQTAAAGETKTYHCLHSTQRTPFIRFFLPSSLFK